ncbi:hypothetical protein O6H91_Y339200 [Diphasiastrum complanatum]|nr:hypothetical protein O6H91_Y339200 [Diphasiastrum complanatum]
MSNLDPPQGIFKEPSKEDASCRIKFVKGSHSPEKATLNSPEIVFSETADVSNLQELINKEDSAPVGVDFEMEVPITEEDMIRAGGLGARDNLSSLLPSAMDATDLEASLRDAWSYENAEGNKISRPGLGLKDPCQYQQGALGNIKPTSQGDRN